MGVYMWALLSFRGRTSRLAYWRIWLACNLVGAVFVVLALFALQGVGALGAILFAPAILFAVAAFAAWVRRLHDRGKGIWWAILFAVAPFVTGSMAEYLSDQNTTASLAESLPFSLAALALSIWAIVEVGFRRGQLGTNRFGDPPAA